MRARLEVPSLKSTVPRGTDNMLHIRHGWGTGTEARGGGGLPERIMTISRPASVSPITGAG
jgi:hypothetical protein